MKRVPKNRYVTVDEAFGIMDSWRDSFPNLCRLEILGQSSQGTPLKLLIISENPDCHDQFPAIWIDGATHAGEWAGYMACLMTAECLLTKNGALRSGRTYYIYPFVSPDGVRETLENHTFCRSAPQCHDHQKTDEKGWRAKKFTSCPGLYQLRWQSPLGPWKEDKECLGLMVPRIPSDTEGPFYFVMTEGEFVGFESYEIHRDLPPIPVADARTADFNRNWPTDWQAANNFGSSGYGSFPGSVPEVQAVLQFLSKHRNISVINTHHTHGGVHILPGPSDKRGISEADKGAFDYLRELAKSSTGYEVSYFSDSIADAGYIGTSHGTFDLFGYMYLGCLTTTTEVWRGLARVGLQDEKNWLRDFGKWARPENLRLYHQYLSKHYPEVLKPWELMHHPQLGTVECGGWNMFLAFTNPPEPIMAEECGKVVAFNLGLQNLLPEIKILNHFIRNLEKDTHEVGIRVGNVGALSTSGMEMAKDKLWQKPIKASLTFESGEILSPIRLENSTSLRGACRHLGTWDITPLSVVYAINQSIIEFRWIVRGQGVIKAYVESQRAGHATLSFEV